MTSTKKIISGAAIGTLLGSLVALAYQRRNEILERVRDHSGDFNDLKEMAKEYGGALINKGRQLNFRKMEPRTNYWKSGFIGLMAGAGAALLLAPKSGKSLRGQLSRVYNDFSEKSEEVIHQFKNNSLVPFATHPNGVKRKRSALKAKKTSKVHPKPEA